MNECKICKTKSNNLENHHIIPKSRGGDDSDCNLIEICSKCHGLAHDVSFSNERGGLIKEAILNSRKKQDSANKWIEENTDLVDEKMSNLYYKDEDKHMLMLLLLERGSFSSSKIKEWVIKGRVTFKISITF